MIDSVVIDAIRLSKASRAGSPKVTDSVGTMLSPTELQVDSPKFVYESRLCKNAKQFRLLTS